MTDLLASLYPGQKPDLQTLLPHAGKMCLLGDIIKADETTLSATAISHLEKDNPLEIDGTIAMINGIEYAAQAMAVHGSLLAQYAHSDNMIQTGYLASVRNIQIKKPLFPATILFIEVELLMSNTHGFTYQFQINSEQEELISGKITIILTQ